MDMDRLFDEGIGNVVRAVVVDGHRVVITAGSGTSILGPGGGWSWLTADGPPYLGIAPSLDEMREWSDADAEAWARRALAACHSDPTPIACPVCED